MNDVIDGASLASAPHYAPLLRAMQAGELVVVLPDRRSPPEFLAALPEIARPVLVLVRDDDGAATGPPGWASADRLGRWEGTVVLRAAAPVADHYRLAVHLTIARGILLCVETDRVRLPEWSALLDSEVRSARIKGSANG